MVYKFKINDNENWWGGSALYGDAMPLNKDSEYKYDFRVISPNQTMPLFVSDKGRYIWSENNFAVEIKGGEFVFDGEDINIYEAGDSLKDAYMTAMKVHFPFSGKKLPDEFFTTAQYNTWIEYIYHPTQEGVMKYANAIVENGFKPGILIIDEGWHGRYGDWTFDKYKFPNPKEMMDKLHQMGFKVMLWVVPYVCADGEDFVRNAFFDNKVFMRNKEGEIALIKWWNGYSAILNLAKEADREFLDNKLQFLMKEYGVDGFKFDGGTVQCYTNANVMNGEMDTDLTPEELNKAWNEFGERYTFHEYKDTFKGGGKSVIQRQCDKNCTWTGNGINKLVPTAILQGLLGHPFICPDMVYGGEWKDFAYGMPEIDEELFVRSAQCSALFPMMQFSLSPWKALSKKSLDKVIAAAKVHSDFADKILTLVRNAEKTGEPIIRAMEYEYPHMGYEKTTDQFMLGSDILVSPVTTQGTTEKEIAFPEGSWKDSKGKVYEGGKTHKVNADIDTLPWFKKIK